VFSHMCFHGLCRDSFTVNKIVWFVVQVLSTVTVSVSVSTAGVQNTFLEL